jgi:hypothetical protein
MVTGRRGMSTELTACRRHRSDEYVLTSTSDLCHPPGVQRPFSPNVRFAERGSRSRNSGSGPRTRQLPLVLKQVMAGSPRIDHRPAQSQVRLAHTMVDLLRMKVGLL